MSGLVIVTIGMSPVSAAVCVAYFFHATRGSVWAEWVWLRLGWIPGVYWIISGMRAVNEGKWGAVVIDVLFAAWLLWLWWSDTRKHRRRLADRVTGVVRDLGHRLAVAPVPAGSRA